MSYGNLSCCVGVACLLVFGYLCIFPDIGTGLRFLDLPVPEVVSNSQEWGMLEVNRSVSKSPLRIHGRRYWTGFGTHAASKIRLRIPSGSTGFKGACGLDDQTRGKGVFTCEVKINGKVMWSSAAISFIEPIRFFDIEVEEGGFLDLEILAAPRGIDSAHANWVRLQFLKE